MPIFLHDPKKEHTKVVKIIGQYLKGTVKKGIFCHRDGSGVTCYNNADFSEKWDPGYAVFDTATAQS